MSSERTTVDTKNRMHLLYTACCVLLMRYFPPLCLHGNRYPAYIRELKRAERLSLSRKIIHIAYNPFLAINTFYLKKVFLIKAFVLR